MNELQERNELVGHALGKLREMHQKWTDRLTINNLRLGDRYLEGEIEVFVHLKRRSVGPTNTGQFCLILRHGKNVSQQEAVFIGVVQLAEFPERVVPTLVGLSQLDEVYSARIHSLYFSSKLSFVFGRSFLDRESRSAAGRTAAGLNQATSKMVKSAAEIMDSVPNDQTKVRRQFLPKLKDAVAGLQVLIAPDRIVVGFSKDSDPTFEITDVVFGPFDFRPDADKAIH